MSKLNRKQIPVCSACQDKIHKGSYDGLSLKHIKNLNNFNLHYVRGEPYAVKVALASVEGCSLPVNYELF